MSAVDDFATEAGAGDDVPPIADYEELTVGRILPLLDGMSRAQLWQVHEYERRHANRMAILEALERALA
jgi:hypothetical protein